MRRLWMLIALGLGLLVGAVLPPGWAQSVTLGVLPNNCTNGQIAVSNGSNLWSCSSASGGGAPLDAEYWVASANVDLTNEVVVNDSASRVRPTIRMRRRRCPGAKSTAFPLSSTEFQV